MPLRITRARTPLDIFPSRTHRIATISSLIQAFFSRDEHDSGKRRAATALLLSPTHSVTIDTDRARIADEENPIEDFAALVE